MNVVIKSPLLGFALATLLLPIVGCGANSSGTNTTTALAPTPLSSPTAKPVLAKPKAKLPSPTSAPLPKPFSKPVKDDSYTLVEDLSSENSGTFKIRWQVIAKDTSSKEKLSQLADKLTALAQAKVQPSEARPVVFDLKIYADREHLRQAQQWVAWVFKAGDQSQPETRFDDVQIGQKEKTSTKKFGLTEEKRKAIFIEIAKAEDRANEAAMQRFPDDWAKAGIAYSEQRDEYAEKVATKYKRAIAKSHLIKYQYIDEITSEGMVNSWPLP